MADEIPLLELTETQVKTVVIASLRQRLQLALTPALDAQGNAAPIDQDLVDSIKQVMGIYMTLEEHKNLMQEAALYELQQTAMAQGSPAINPD